MSYNVSLIHEATGMPAMVPSHQEGGVIALGGSDFADMSVTYNYSKFIREYITGGLREFDGTRAKYTIPLLRKAVAELGTERDVDYWKATPGNAGYALSVMLQWAEMHPDAVWSVS